MKTIAIAAVMMAFAAQPPETEGAALHAPADVLTTVDPNQVGVTETGGSSDSVFMFKFNNAKTNSFDAREAFEPAALMFVLGGLGLVGAVMRRRARLTVTYT
jgi:hypothetical protein